MRDEYYIPDIPRLFRWIPPLSNSQACRFEIHTETVGEIKGGDKTERTKWTLRGGPRIVDSDSTIQHPPNFTYVHPAQ